MEELSLVVVELVVDAELDSGFLVAGDFSGLVDEIPELPVEPAGEVLLANFDSHPVDNIIITRLVLHSQIEISIRLHMLRLSTYYQSKCTASVARQDFESLYFSTTIVYMPEMST